mgnify:CR=1 FL=1
MKYILKAKESQVNEDKPYILRFNELVKPALCALSEFDCQAMDDIPISTYQKDMLLTCARTFFIVSYYPPSVLRYIIEHIEGLDHWAFCTHDRDCTEDGEKKKEHTHLLLYFGERVSASMVCSWFHTTQFKIISRTDITNEWNYLIHDSKACRRARKYLYDKSERLTDDEDYWLARCTGASENDKFVCMIDDMIKVQQCKLTYREYIKRYGAFAIMQMENIRKAAVYFMHDNDYFDGVQSEKDDNINEVF